jgi:hypothetical protein
MNKVFSYNLTLERIPAVKDPVKLDDDAESSAALT